MLPSQKILFKSYFREIYFDKHFLQFVLVVRHIVPNKIFMKIGIFINCEIFTISNLNIEKTPRQGLTKLRNVATLKIKTVLKCLKNHLYFNTSSYFLKKFLTNGRAQRGKCFNISSDFS